MNTPEIEDVLTSAIEAGDVNVVRDLLTRNPEFVTHDYGMGTWLHLAANEPSTELAQLLLDLGCDVDAEWQFTSAVRLTPLPYERPEYGDRLGQR